MCSCSLLHPYIYLYTHFDKQPVGRNLPFYFISTKYTHTSYIKVSQKKKHHPPFFSGSLISFPPIHHNYPIKQDSKFSSNFVLVSFSHLNQYRLIRKQVVLYYIFFTIIISTVTTFNSIQFNTRRSIFTFLSPTLVPLA